jgi:hypothetical protein
LKELRLTENGEFENTISKMNPKKLHCALCINEKTMFGCSTCKVALCKTSKDKSHKNQSCFMIWHNHINLTIEHHKIRQAYRGSCSRNSIEVNYSDEEKEEDDDNDGLDNGDGTPQSKDVKKTTERQLHARAQIRYAEVEEEEDTEGDNNGNEGMQKKVHQKNTTKSLWSNSWEEQRMPLHLLDSTHNASHGEQRKSVLKL